MGSELKIFENESFGSVRIVAIEGQPWFVAKDVCEVLGLTWNGNIRIAHVPGEWKGVTSVVTPSGKQEMAILSEHGLYFFLARSDKPKALPFQKWLAGEVLPSIRKTGGYGIPQNYAEALRALAAEVELKEAEQQQRMLAEAQRDEAIRTKAEIGSRREATAMATASSATRKAQKLEDAIGFGKNYKQVKGITWLKDVFEDCRAMYVQVGKTLSKLSKRLGYEVRDIPDSQYGIIKAYHVDVINALLYELKRDVNMLSKWRIAEKVV